MVDNFFDVFSNDELDAISYAARFALNNSQNKDELLKSWISEYLHTDYILPPKNECKADYLFLRSLNRPDYKDLFESIIKASNSNSLIIIQDFALTNEKINIEASKFLTKNRKVIHRLAKYNSKEKQACAIKLCSYAFLLYKISDFEFDNLVCFSDM